MADKTIGQLPVSAGLDDNSLLVTEQGGEARSITGALVKRFAKDSVAEETAKAEQAAKDAAAAKTSVDASKASIDQSKSSIDQTKAAIDGIKTDIDTAKASIDQANLDVAQNKSDAEAAAQSAGTSAASAAKNAGLAAAALEEANDIVEEVTGLRDEALNTVKSAVLFTEQSLTDAQKEQAKANIGAPFDKGPSGTVKWDGSTSNLVSITVNAEPELGYAGESYYLMPRTSSKVPPAATLEALGGAYTYQTGADKIGDNGTLPELATVAFGAGSGNLDSASYPGATIVGDMVIVVHEANTPLYNITVEKPGVYFRKYWQSPNFYQTQVTEMTLTNGVLDDGLERLPKKFLPEGVAMESYVVEKIDEASPFLVTLTDGKANCTMADLWYRRNDRAGVYLLDANEERLHMTGVTEQEIPVRNNRGEIIRYRYEYYARFARVLPSFPALEGITLHGSSLEAIATTESYSTKTLIATDGGTMTGALTLNGDPTEAKHAATKQYVDEKATWENLQGKPTIIEGTPDTLTWDGDTTGRDSVEGVYFKVSDATLTMSDLANGGEIVFNGESQSFTADNCMEASGAIIINQIVVSVSDEAAGSFGCSPGVYFAYQVAPGSIVYVSRLTIPGYTGFGKEVIDPDYLPESVKGGSGGVVYVKLTATDDASTFETDKTFADIKPAYDAGSLIVAKVPVNEDGSAHLLPLTTMDETNKVAMFMQTVFMGAPVQKIVVLMDSSGNTATAMENTLATATS